VKWLVIREVLTLAGTGVALALPAAWALARLVEVQLYGVKPGDAGSSSLALAALAAVALLAGYLPVQLSAAAQPLNPE
jgi:hypothetical protein